MMNALSVRCHSVEILGSVYERFLGKVVRPHGKGITVEEKPEVRKAGASITPALHRGLHRRADRRQLLDEIAGGARLSQPQQGDIQSAE